MGAQEFFVYAPGVDAATAFAHAVDRATTEARAAAWEDRDDPDEGWDEMLDYDLGTIATKTGFELVRADPLEMAEATRLAEQRLGGEDERFRCKDGPAGAVAVRGAQQLRRLELDRSDLPESTGGDWRASVARAVVALRYPTERFQDIESSVFTTDSDGRPVRGEMTVRTTGAPDQHTGWLFFGNAPS